MKQGAISNPRQPNQRHTGDTSERAAERRALFAKEYLTDRNGTQAAIRAGYSPRSAHAQANKLLKKPDVRAIIDAGHAAATKKLDITRDTILEELAKIAFANPLDFGHVVDGQFQFDLSETTRDHMAAVQELTSDITSKGDSSANGKVISRRTKLKLANKREALVDLGKAIGVFKDDPSAGQPVTFIIQNLHVEQHNGRSQGEGGGAEEFVDPALQARNVRGL